MTEAAAKEVVVEDHDPVRKEIRRLRKGGVSFQIIGIIMNMTVEQAKAIIGERLASMTPSREEILALPPGKSIKRGDTTVTHGCDPYDPNMSNGRFRFRTRFQEDYQSVVATREVIQDAIFDLWKYAVEQIEISAEYHGYHRMDGTEVKVERK